MAIDLRINLCFLSLIEISTSAPNAEYRSSREAGTRHRLRDLNSPLDVMPLFRVSRKAPLDRSTVSTLGNRPRASIRPFVPEFPLTDLLIAPSAFRSDAGDATCSVHIRTPLGNINAVVHFPAFLLYAVPFDRS